MVGPFYFVLHSWLAGIAGRNKPLINMKAHLQICIRKHPSAAFFYWAMPESGIQVTGYQS